MFNFLNCKYNLKKIIKIKYNIDIHSYHEQYMITPYYYNNNQKYIIITNENIKSIPTINSFDYLLSYYLFYYFHKITNEYIKDIENIFLKIHYYELLDLINTIINSYKRNKYYDMSQLLYYIEFFNIFNNQHIINNKDPNLKKIYDECITQIIFDIKYTYKNNKKIIEKLTNSLNEIELIKNNFINTDTIKNNIIKNPQDILNNIF